MSTTNDSVKQVELLEQTRKKRAALEARLRKESYRQIADDLGVSIGTVRVWIKEMTQTYLPQEEIEELRAQEAASIDDSEARAHWAMNMLQREGARLEKEEKSISHILDQIARWQEHIINLRKQRALLLGLNTPVTVKHNVTVRTEFDAEVEELTSMLLGGGNVMSSPEDVDTGTVDAV